MLERRFSSSFIRSLLVFSLIFGPTSPIGTTQAFAAPAQAQSGNSPTPSLSTEHDESALDEVRLPPILETLLLIVLYACNPTHPDAINPEHHKDVSEPARYVALTTVLNELPKVYGNPEIYTGPAITSLSQYLQLVEPTRGIPSGSLRGDAEDLVRRFKNGTIPRAVRITADKFADSTVAAQAEIYQYRRDSKFEALLKSLSGTGTFTSTIAGSVMKGVLGLLLTTGGLAHTMRALSKAATPVASDEPPPASNAQKSTPTGKPAEAPKTPVAQKAEQASFSWQSLVPGSLAVLAGIGTTLGSGADLMELLAKAGSDETHLLQFVERLAAMEPGQKIQFLHTMQTQLIPVISSIQALADGLANSPEVAKLADKRTRQILNVFFSTYPPTLETDVMQNVILDILRAPPDTDEIGLAGILLKHYDPIAIQFLQTVTGLGGGDSEQDGRVSRIISMLCDKGLKVPYSQIQETLAEDQNGYPLQDLQPVAINAGKLFQVHFANFRNSDGIVKPVVARILKPGIEERLEQARHRFLIMAPKLADALKDENGRGPSSHRIEQLVEMFFRLLQAELRVDQTVANHGRGQARLVRSNKVRLRNGAEAVLDIEVPKAYAAAPHSKVMVMDRIPSPIPLDSMKRRHPEVLKHFAEMLYDVTGTEALITPMLAAIKGEVPETGKEDLSQGVMHADLHPGNVYFTVSRDSDGTQHYKMWLLDYGLFLIHGPEEAKHLSTLAAGASYNNGSFIVSALWNLRDSSMRTSDARKSQKDRAGLEKAVAQEIENLNSEKKYLTAADWVKRIWEMEILDFPDWLVLMQQGFRALRKSVRAFGLTDTEINQLETDFAQEHKATFRQFLSTRTKGLSWTPIYSYEARTCISRLLGWSTTPQPQ